MTQSADAAEIVANVARFGLPAGERNGTACPADDAWPGALASLRTARITGFAVAGLEAGWLQLSDEQTRELLAAHREAMLAPLVVERGLLELAPAFEEASIEFVVLKGPSLAHTVYPDPYWRYFGDLDLLVRAADWARASELLQGLGYRRSFPDPRPGFVARFGGASAHRSPGGVEVDLHRTIVLGPFGLWVDADRLFDSTSEFPLGDTSFRRLDDTSLLLHACMHASLGNWPPLTVPVRDVAQIAHFAQVDWNAVMERGARWKLRSVTRHALQYASNTLAVPLPPGALAVITGPTSRKERRALDAYITDRRNRGGEARATLSAIRGIRAKGAYILGLLLPDRAFLAARGHGSYVRRWRVALRWRPGRARK